MNTDTLLSEFRSRQETKKADSSARTYAHTAKVWAKWLAEPGEKDFDHNSRGRPSKDLWEATTGDLQVFLRQQLQSGLTGGTVQSRRWHISILYDELREMRQEGGYGIPDFENPAEDLDVSDWQTLNVKPRKQQESKELDYLEPKEVKNLYENASTPTLRNELIIRLLYQTGLRRGELTETRLEDVDTDERAIKVHAEKTHLNRTVFYQSSLDTLMTRWVNVERKSLSTAGSEYLFPTYKTEQISPKQIGRVVRNAAESAGLQSVLYTDASGQEQVKITAHILRHSFAVQSIKNGMDTRRLQMLMGHANIDTTERYLKFANEDLKDAVRKHGAGSESVPSS
ncbi:tyrosine-type recombinase/integrase [Haloarcula argentinensis]|uniref:Tyrosine-type recombinase/integrase n=1 Tax=Haloarcula argentinensis TaxID=43776 RepID=A0ABU2EXH6_HALAR|nr:tyrosine-type recombinase/integrase [Haloarcula argentinensis]EMA22156.1 site-specific recombinase xerd [Haloarcula argentinensis DSM 12282]MDS0252535.1 tyrosine-type recombinase/integrase [Haloarcula argentinensis]